MRRNHAPMATYADVKKRIDQYREVSMRDEVLQRYKDHAAILGHVVSQGVSDDGEYNVHQQVLVDKLLIVNDSLKPVRIEEKFRGKVFPYLYIDVWVKWPFSTRWFPGFGINPAAKCDYFAFIWHKLNWEMLLFERIPFQNAVSWVILDACGNASSFAPWDDNQFNQRRKDVRSIKPTWKQFLDAYEMFEGKNIQEMHEKVKRMRALQAENERRSQNQLSIPDNRFG